MSYASTVDKEGCLEEERVLLGSFDATSAGLPNASFSETPLSQRIANKVGLLVLPFAMAAAIGAPDLRRQSTRAIRKAEGSQSGVVKFEATQDTWEVYREYVAVEEIRALNAMLAMPAIEGSRIESDLD